MEFDISTTFGRALNDLVEKHITEVSDPNINRAPVVSVALVTYNHAKSIEKALESVLVQETPFPFEIVISDDYSTDGTRKIICQYQERLPEQIRLILADRNLWQAIPGLATSPTCNLAVLSACRGKYIALLEGDDYWIHPQKLALQTALLEANPTSSLCFTAANETRRADNGSYGQACERRPRVEKPFYGPEDAVLIPWQISHTSTFLLRNNYVRYPSWICGVLNADTAIVALYLRKSTAVFLDEVTSVHNVTLKGIYSSMAPIRMCAESLETFSKIYEMDQQVYGYVEREFCVSHAASIVYLMLRSPSNALYMLKRPKSLWRIAGYCFRYPVVVAMRVADALRAPLRRLLKRGTIGSTVL